MIAANVGHGCQRQTNSRTSCLYEPLSNHKPLDVGGGNKQEARQLDTQTETMTTRTCTRTDRQRDRWLQDMDDVVDGRIVYNSRQHTTCQKGGHSARTSTQRGDKVIWVVEWHWQARRRMPGRHCTDIESRECTRCCRCVQTASPAHTVAPYTHTQTTTMKIYRHRRQVCKQTSVCIYKLSSVLSTVLV